MSNSDLSLGILILTVFFSLANLVFFIFYKRETAIKTKSIARVTGLVVDYDSRNEEAVPLPVVEYTVNGEIYRKKFKYSYYFERPSKKRQTDVFSSVYRVGGGINLKEIFPIGSTMEVHYNPDHPQKGFVERFAGSDKTFKILMLIFSAMYFMLIAIVLGIYFLS